MVSLNTGNKNKKTKGDVSPPNVRSIYLNEKPSLLDLKKSTTSLIKKSKKSTIRFQNSQDSGENSNRTIDFKESSLEEGSDAVISSFKESSIRPPTLYSVVKVELPKEFCDQKKFNENVGYNRNMIIEFISNEFMLFFIHGDQFHEINGNQVNTRKNIETALQQISLLTDFQSIIIKVIRPWNFRCPSKQLFNNINIEEFMSYFVVRVYRFYKNHGFTMKKQKKKIIITNIVPKGNGSFSFLNGDRIIDIEGMNPMISQMMKVDMKLIRKTFDRIMKANGFVDVFCCRPIGIRSSPNPSISAEYSIISGMLTPLSSNRDNDTLKVRISSRCLLNDKKSEVDPPHELDSLEISLRELCRLKEMTADDVCPLTNKGKSLIKLTISMNKSIYFPDAMKSPQLMRQLPATKLKWRKSNRPLSISIKDTPETTKIVSDVSEDVELKKVDARSGIVAYIKNAFG